MHHMGLKELTKIVAKMYSQVLFHKVYYCREYLELFNNFDNELSTNIDLPNGYPRYSWPLQDQNFWPNSYWTLSMGSAVNIINVFKVESKGV